MAAAEGELDARINDAFRAIREATERRRKWEGKDTNEEPIPDEEVDRMRVYVTSHALTPEWPSVIDRISQGELPWQAVERDGADDTEQPQAPRRQTSDQDDDSFEDPGIRTSF